jgi:glycosyltransferase involved in cell wall biosynthesis
MSQVAFALLGRQDHPTDAVEDYCRFLSEALKTHNIELGIRRVPWELHGWPDSLQALELMATKWNRQWVLVQYTALAWSARGFPHKILEVFRILKKAGAQIGVVFHDVEAYPAKRLVEKFRRFLQIRTMRQMVRCADLLIFTVPLEKLSWLRSHPQNAVFIPDGPNLPITTSSSVSHHPPTVAVFSITGGPAGHREARTIIDTLRGTSQKLGPLRLSVFGRHSELREAALRDGLRDVPVQVSVEGILPDQQVAERLCASDVLLFVRGGISSRRGSAIAGIACGLPVICSANSETAPPVTDAGIVFISLDHPEEITAALVRVLSDSAFRQELAARSRAAYRQHFSWTAVAGRFAPLLQRRD